jgi:hypothetical protein
LELPIFGEYPEVTVTIVPAQNDTWSFSRDGIDRGWHEMVGSPVAIGLQDGAPLLAKLVDFTEFYARWCPIVS